MTETRPVSVRGDLDDGPVVVVQGRQAEPAALGQPVHRQQIGVLIGRVEEAELGGRGVILLEVERRLDVVACDNSVRIRDDDAREGNGDRESQDDQRDRADASAGRGSDRGNVELDDPAAAFAAGATGDVRGPDDAHDHAEQADRQGEGRQLRTPDDAQERQDPDGCQRPQRSLGAQHDGERDEGGDQGAQERHDRRAHEDACGRLDRQQVLPRGDQADDEHLDGSPRGHHVEESRRREGQRPAGQQIGGGERQRRPDGAHARRGRECGDQEAHDQAP